MSSAGSSLEKKDILRSQLHQQETAAQIRSEQRNSNDFRVAARQKAEQDNLEARSQTAKQEKVEQEEITAAARVKAEQESAAVKAAAEASALAMAEHAAASKLRAETEAMRVKIKQEEAKDEEDAAARMKAVEEEAAAAAAAHAKTKQAEEEDEKEHSRAFHLRLAQEAARARVMMEQQGQEEHSRELSPPTQVMSVVDGIPFAVMKLRDAKENKIFVNLCISDELQQRGREGERFIVDGSSPRRVQDKKGTGASLTYDVCVGTSSVGDADGENKVSE